MFGGNSRFNPSQVRQQNGPFRSGQTRPAMAMQRPGGFGDFDRFGGLAAFDRSENLRIYLSSAVQQVLKIQQVL